jgi:membrane associated rhomboid family serine protease
MQVLFENLTTDQANTCGLILSASGIPYRATRGEKGWEIWVENSEYASALSGVSEYFRENRQPPAEVEPSQDRFRKTYGGVWAALLLLVFYFVFTSSGSPRDLIKSFGSDSDSILKGELYRVVTSLMLHSDAAHLIGNAAGIAVLGTAVCGAVGWGLGCLMILLSGAAGNLMNAVFFQTGHLSIGASTAVFGAVGLLAGRRFVGHMHLPERKIKAWLPIAGGIALLGFLGSGPQTDLAAHLFGFLSGILFGILLAASRKRPIGESGQRMAMLICIVIVASCWLPAFSHV